MVDVQAFRAQMGIVGPVARENSSSDGNALGTNSGSKAYGDHERSIEPKISALSVRKFNIVLKLHRIIFI